MGGHPAANFLASASLPCKEYQTKFLATDGRSRLQLLPSTQRSLQDLPKSIRNNIFRRVITPEEGIKIDLDTNDGSWGKDIPGATW
jgi:hypothetical protein